MPLRPVDMVRLVVGVLALALPAVAAIGLIIGYALFNADVIGLAAGKAWLTAAGGIGVAALVVLILGRLLRWVAWRWMLALAIPALAPVVAGALAYAWLKDHPSVPEVSTDRVDPPAFAGALAAPLRPGAGAADVHSLTLKAPPAEAFDRALELAETRTGWRVTASQRPETIAGAAVFGRFGYQRDWVIRVRPELGGGALIDMRLRSHPGEEDLGDNPAVVRDFLTGLAAQAE